MISKDVKTTLQASGPKSNGISVTCKTFFFFEELHVKLKYDKSNHICKYFFICTSTFVSKLKFTEFHHVTPNEVSSLKLIYFHMQLLARN